MMDSTSSNNVVRTMVLVGRTGNGKSATGNSILGKKVFKSRASSSGVTSTCELHSIVRSDGQIVNVIDTPGLFVGSEFVGKEIVKCIDMAKDGIHAILLVLPIKTRFSQEVVTLHGLQTLFGNKIINYMIVVFTGGDEQEENDETLEDYLGRKCSMPLKEILALCGNRCVLFDNKTKDERKQFGQVQQLLLLVNKVISQNGGRPYTNELFVELKVGAMKLHNKQREVDSLEGYSKADISEFKKQMQPTCDDLLKRITETVESKFKEANTILSQQLAEETAARLKVEENANSTQFRLDNEIEKLRQNLEEMGAMKLHNQQREVVSLDGYSKAEILEFKKQMHQTYDDQRK